jgi:hypothetical protein
MFEGQKPAAPDVLDVADPAVARREPAVPVWVDLGGLTDHKKHGRPYSPSQRDGVFIAGMAPGILWAWIRTDRGMWLGVVTMELERAGAPVMSVPAVVPDWALSRRMPGSRRAHRGKSSDRPTVTQRAAEAR